MTEPGSPDPKDRRVLRTRKSLRDALIALILERGWEEVTVQDVCDRADVGRSTFYTHFTDRENLLVGGFDDLRKALRGPLAVAPGDERPLAFVGGLVQHAHENQRVFRAVVGKRSGQVVQRRFRQLVVELVREDLQALAASKAKGPPAEATVRYVAGALLELLTWWIDVKSGLSPAELTRLFEELTAPVLATLPRR